MTVIDPRGGLRVLRVDRVVDDGHRGDYGNLDALCESITQLGGLLHPITVAQVPGTKTYQVIAGRRRLAAYRALGKPMIPAQVTWPDAAPDDLLVAEAVENAVRKQPTWSERAKISRELTALVEAGKLPRDRGERTRETVARYLGVGERTLRKAVELVDLAATAPEEVRARVCEMVAEMDETGKVDGPWSLAVVLVKAAEYEAAEPGQLAPHDPQEGGGEEVSTGRESHPPRDEHGASDGPAASADEEVAVLVEPSPTQEGETNPAGCSPAGLTRDVGQVAPPESMVGAGADVDPEPTPPAPETPAPEDRHLAGRDRAEDESSEPAPQDAAAPRPRPTTHRPPSPPARPKGPPAVEVGTTLELLAALAERVERIPAGAVEAWCAAAVDPAAEARRINPLAERVARWAADVRGHTVA